MQRFTLALITCLLLTTASHAQMRPFDIDRHAKTIEEFRKYDRKNTAPSPHVLFVGSSSIVLWPTAEAFPALNVINRGFGGASVQEINHFYADVIGRYNPRAVVVYSDIEIENGATPDQTIANYKLLISRLKTDFPAAKIFLLSMKPTLIDHKMGAEVRGNKEAANKMLEKIADADEQLVFVDVSTAMIDAATGKLRQDIFVADGLHLGAKGYQLWNEIMNAQFKKYEISTEK